MLGAMKKKHSGQFKKGDSRISPRPKGAILKSTRLVQQRFAELVTPHIEEYIGVVQELTKPEVEGEFCPLCGRGMRRPDELRLKASTALLDRSGLHPKLEIEVSDAPSTAWLHYLTDAQLQQLAVWKAEAMKHIPNSDNSAVIEAEAERLD